METMEIITTIGMGVICVAFFVAHWLYEKRER